MNELGVTQMETQTRARLRDTLAAYVELTKPGILRLLLITTFCAMLVAARGMPDLGLIFWTLLGMAMVSGSANAMNMVYDQDIDAVMARTEHRPIPSGRLETRAALAFASLLGLAGFLLLNVMVNPMTALSALGGHLFYVLIYTMWLKRSTPQNIVIGGAAGAAPPLVGWAAVTGELSVAAWIMFAIIFFWTPPHFWALALYKRTDYARARVPMLPVVRGEPYTKRQMLYYTLLLLPVTLLLALSHLGWLYLASALVLGLGFVWFAWKVLREQEGHRWAKQMFAYSLLYLALLFGAMSLDAIFFYPLIPKAQNLALELVPAVP
jgi:protoheme IX farnesyltransferase